MIDTRNYEEIENEDFEVCGYVCQYCGMTYQDEAETECCCMSDEEILGLEDYEDEE